MLVIYVEISIVHTVPMSAQSVAHKSFQGMLEVKVVFFVNWTNSKTYFNSPKVLDIMRVTRFPGTQRTVRVKMVWISRVLEKQ